MVFLPPYHSNHFLSNEFLEADSFAVAGASSNACGKEDDSDCTEYCGATGATASCKADGNKVTCYCKGKGDDAGEKCEERCLLCKSREIYEVKEEEGN